MSRHRQLPHGGEQSQEQDGPVIGSGSSVEYLVIFMGFHVVLLATPGGLGFGNGC
jgi:hypothetical protein